MNMKNNNFYIKISQIRKKAKYFHSNIYQSSFSQILNIVETEETVAILVQDRDVKRGYFATGNLDELVSIIKKWPYGTGIEFLSKAENCDIKEYFEAAGFVQYAVYIKTENKKLPDTLKHIDTDRFRYNECEKFISDISIEDSKEIHNLLYKAFNPLTSHIESENELQDRIMNGNIVIHKENGKIVTILTFNVKPKAIYMEHMLNEGKSEYMHMLYYAVLKNNMNKGVLTSDTWIRKTNVRAFNFVRRYGLFPGSLKNFVFCKRK